jgi:hypothetical protein
LTYPTDTDLVLNELRPRGVDAPALIALDRAPSTPFDDTGASFAALLASCQDAAGQVRERWGGRPKAACIARVTFQMGVAHMSHEHLLRATELLGTKVKPALRKA